METTKKNPNESLDSTLETLSKVSGVIFIIGLAVKITQNFIFPFSPDNLIKETPTIFTVISGACLLVSSFILLKKSISKINSAAQELQTYHDTITNDLSDFVNKLKEDAREETIRMISPLAMTTSLVNDPLKREFINDIYNKFGMRLTEISGGMITEDDPFLYHEFAMKLFNMVKQNGEIIASSNVDPNGFWEEDEIDNYLENNKNLIENKQVKFVRYFFIDSKNKDSSKKAIAKNIKIGADVCIIDKDRNDKLVLDGGIIDNQICIKSILNKDNQIIKVHAFYNNHSEFKNISIIINKWKGASKKATDYYSMTKEQFLEII